MQKKKVLIFVDSEQGFGHLNVIDKVATELTQKGAEVTIATGSRNHAGNAFHFESATVYDLPTIQYKGRTAMDVATGKPYEESSLPERQSRVQKILENEQPDLVLFELFPFLNTYMRHDAETVKQWREANHRKVPMVSLSRDSSDSFEPQMTLDCIEKYIDNILVRGCGTVLRLEESMPQWKTIQKPIEYTGNIVSQMPPPENSDTKPVVIFGGGGYFPHCDKDFYINAIKSHTYAGKLAQQPWHIYLSENCPQADRQELEKLAAEIGNIKVLSPVDSHQFKQILSNASAAIMRGGYNTSFELATAQIPFVMIPRPAKEILDEQNQRALTMSKKGYCESIRHEMMNPQAIGEALLRQYTKEHKNSGKLNTTGAEGAATRILDIIRESQSVTPSEHQGKLSAAKSKLMNA